MRYIKKTRIKAPGPLFLIDGSELIKPSIRNSGLDLKTLKFRKTKKA